MAVLHCTCQKAMPQNFSIRDEISIFTADDYEMEKKAMTWVEEFEHSC